MIFVRLIILVAIAGPVLFASAQSNDEALAGLEALAKTFDKDTVMYRWQSQTSAENLLKAGKMNDQLHKYFMGLKDGVAAGPGLYMAETPSSSSSFGDHIIEIHIKKGQKFLDLNDPQTTRALRNLGLTVRDVYWNLQPKLLIRYSGDWWVAKGTEGLSFHPFDIRTKSIPELLNISPDTQVIGPQVNARLNELVKRVDAKTLAKLSKHETAQLTERVLQPGFSEDIVKNKNLRDFILKNGGEDGLVRLFTADPKLLTNKGVQNSIERLNLQNIPRAMIINDPSRLDRPEFNRYFKDENEMDKLMVELMKNEGTALSSQSIFDRYARRPGVLDKLDEAVKKSPRLLKASHITKALADQGKLAKTMEAILMDSPTFMGEKYIIDIFEKHPELNETLAKFVSTYPERAVGRDALELLKKRKLAEKVLYKALVDNPRILQFDHVREMVEGSHELGTAVKEGVLKYPTVINYPGIVAVLEKTGHLDETLQNIDMAKAFRENPELLKNGSVQKLISKSDKLNETLVNVIRTNPELFKDASIKNLVAEKGLTEKTIRSMVESRPSLIQAGTISQIISSDPKYNDIPLKAIKAQSKLFRDSKVRDMLKGDQVKLTLDFLANEGQDLASSPEGVQFFLNSGPEGKAKLEEMIRRRPSLIRDPSIFGLFEKGELLQDLWKWSSNDRRNLIYFLSNDKYSAMRSAKSDRVFQLIKNESSAIKVLKDEAKYSSDREAKALAEKRLLELVEEHDKENFPKGLSKMPTADRCVMEHLLITFGSR